MNSRFWQSFAKTTWEKKAAVYRDIDSSLRQIDEKRIFQMLVQYSDHCRQLGQAIGLKLYLEGERQHEQDTLQFLPVLQDQSLQGFHKRMQKMFPDYCLVCDELLQVSHESWGLLADFTNQLYKAVGFPNRFSELGLYLGNYKKTPFGVHVDGCGVFSFPAVGTKKFRLWSPDYVRKNPDLIEAHQYDEFKKASQILIVKPGDMSYWPSQAWHIAESDGSFSATWSLGVWVDRAHLDVVTASLKNLVSAKLGSASEMKTVMTSTRHDSKGKMSALPKLYQQTVKELQKLKHQEIEDLFSQAWMEHSSRQGLKNFPNISAKVRLSIRSKIKNRLPSPILWQPLSKSYGFAFDGQSFQHPASKALLSLIQDLNLGKTCQVRDYLKTKTQIKEIAFLQKLQDAGAFA